MYEGRYDENGHQDHERDEREEIVYTTAQRRSIPVCIILTLVTCGIYGFYWVYKLNEDVNDLARDREATGGGLVILFMIITCGIYGWYWLYKMGEKCNRIRQDNGSSHILYMVLGIVGLAIVSYALIQDTINTVLE